MHVETPLLHFHDVRVNLTHVAAAVGLFQLSDTQMPRLQVVVRDGDARIVRHHFRMQTENSLILSPHPRHLKPTINN